MPGQQPQQLLLVASQVHLPLRHTSSNALVQQLLYPLTAPHTMASTHRRTSTGPALLVSRLGLVLV